jgi:hypothetical protein
MSSCSTILDSALMIRYIEEADILEALAFAARLAQGHEVRLAG